MGSPNSGRPRRPVTLALNRCSDLLVYVQIAGRDGIDTREQQIIKQNLVVLNGILDRADAYELGGVQFTCNGRLDKNLQARINGLHDIPRECSEGVRAVVRVKAKARCHAQHEG